MASQDKSPLEFIKSLRRLNVDLRVEGDRLRCNAPKGTLTPALRAELSKRKVEVLTLLKSTKTQKISKIKPVDRDQRLPLSFAQQRLWFLDQLFGQSPTYNTVRAFKVSGHLNVKALEQAIGEIVRRHEVLRTTFQMIDSEVTQVIRSAKPLMLSIVDLQSLSTIERLEEANRLVEEATSTVFDLSKNSLIRLSLIKLASDSHVLVVVIHHIVSDGWSSGIFAHELSVLYRDFSQGKSPSLPVLSLQYADFSCWQRQWLVDEVLEKQLDYWKQQLKGLSPSLDLPTDYLRPPQQTYSGERHVLTLSASLTQSLKALNQKTHSTLYMVLLTAFQVLLFRQTWKSDIAVGTPIANRNRREVENLIGFFVNTLVIRTDLKENPTFLELLEQVKKNTVAAYEHQDLPFEKLIETLSPTRNLSYHPIVQVVFNLLNQPQAPLELESLQVEPFPLNRHISEFDFGLNVIEKDDHLVCTFIYNTDLFKSLTIHQWAQQFQVILNEIVVRPEQSIATLSRLKTTEDHCSCVLIGQGNLLISCGERLLRSGHSITHIVSADQQTYNWAKERGIPWQASSQALVKMLKQESFDYLFSIFNLEKLPPELLQLPKKGAINLHDSLLPQYGGLYAPSWAIFQQEALHGITWHFMSAGIDEGDILRQIEIPISETETALSLSSKCYDAALQSFPTLIDDLLADRMTPQPQNLDQRSYFNAIQRPTPGCVVDWGWSAEEIAAFFKALDFRPYANAFGLPKLYSASNFYVVADIEISNQSTNVPPGTLINIENGLLQLSTASQDIIVKSLQALEGQAIDLLNWVAQNNLQVGDQFESVPTTLRKSIETLEATCLRKEAFWVDYLTSLNALELPLLVQASGPPSTQQTISQWEPSDVVKTLFSELSIIGNPQKIVLALLVGYFSRISQRDTFDLGLSGLVEPLSSGTLAQLFSTVTPCRIAIEKVYSLKDLITQILQSVRVAQQNQTFHRDIVHRYPELDAVKSTPIEQQFPVTISLTDSLTDRSLNEAKRTSSTAEFAIDKQGNFACRYSNQQYRERDINRLLQSFSAFVEQWALSPAQQLNALSLLSAADVADIARWQQPTVDFPQQRVFELFEAQVERTPSATALVDGATQKSLTYQQLNQRANQLAHYLRESGVQAETLVGLCLNRSIEMMIGVLGILKAGGAYLPLDPVHPREKLEFITAEAVPALILSQDSCLSAIASITLPKLCLDTDWNKIAQSPTQNLEPLGDLNTLAYVIYTSGSTGTPKGVMVEHASLSNFSIAAQQTYGLSNSDIAGRQQRILQFASISFDAAAEEIYPSLISGHTLVLRTDNMIVSVAHFLQTCQDWQLTILDLPTAYWQQIVIKLIAEKITLPNTLQLVIIGGEQVSSELVRSWQTHVGDMPKLINTYGPTEGTVVATAYPIKATATFIHEVPIGRALQNVHTYVLDQHLHPVPVGVPGELYLGGHGLARGYLNRPELTRERFISDPFGDDPTARIYKTGDLVRHLAEGDLNFLGRIDQQVKIRGFRIELGEIEAVLTQYPEVEESIILVKEDIAADKSLIAYVVPDQQQVLSLEALRIFLRQKLPSYMVPSALVPIEAVPLTPNGKIDRHALAEIGIGRQTLQEAYAAPRTPTEKELVKIWAEVLWLEQDIGIHDNFFDLGGHSLLSVQLIDKIEKKFNQKVPLAALFQLGTVADLARILTEDIEPELKSSDLESSASSKGLDPEIHRKLLAYTAGWQGKRARTDSLIVGSNINGAKQALFWCLQGYRELSQLAKYMGNDQPIYGMRSGHLLMPYTPKNINDLATYYTQEILSIQPNSPYLLGGNCQSATIISKIAQQLQAQGKTITLLCLLENSTFESYSGKVALFFGRESKLNPYKRFLSPELGWHKVYPAGFSVDLLPCDHGQYFKEPDVQVLAEKLKQSIEVAQTEAMQSLPNVGYRAKITCQPSITCYVGEKVPINVKVQNLSPVSWKATDKSGIMLANHWLDEDENIVHWLDASAPLSFDILPNASVRLMLVVNPPQAPGKYKLSLDLVEEGINWFEKKGSQPSFIDIDVLENSRSLSITDKPGEKSHFSCTQVEHIFPYPHLWESGPFVIGGTGGSGTRVAARIFQACDVFLGENLNSATDALDMIDTWLRSILCHLQSVIPVEVYSQSVQNLADSLEQHLAQLASKEKSQLWGWKVPPSIFSLPFLHQQFPNMKCLHLVRDGRDMAFSKNQNQLRYLGPNVLTAEEQTWSLPLRSIALWNALNLCTAEYGEQRMSPEQYLRIRFEDLCLAPIETTQQIIEFFGFKGDAEQISQTEISTPKSFKRWTKQDNHIVQKLNVIGEPALQKFGYLAAQPTDLHTRMQQGFVVPAVADTVRHRSTPSDHLLAQAYEAFEQGQFQSTIVLCGQLLRMLSAPSLPLLQMLGNSHYALAQYDSAGEIYQQAYEHWPEDAALNLKLGQFYLQQQLFEKATYHFQMALDLGSQDIIAVYEGLGLSLEKQQRVDDVIAAYQSLLTHYPDHLQTIQKIATLLYKQKRYDDALNYYRQSATLAPDQPFGAQGVGNVLTVLGQFDRALEAYQQVLDLQPKYPGIFYQIGNLWIKQKNFDAAEAAFKEAIALFPEVARAQVVLGNFYLHHRQQAAEAAHHFRQALILEPQNYIAQKNLSIALMRQDQLDDAITMLCKTKETYPEKVDLYPLLGNLYFRAKLWQPAIESYQRAVELKTPELFNAYYRLGLALHQLQRYEDAAEAYQRAIAEGHDSSQLHKQISHIKQRLSQITSSDST